MTKVYSAAELEALQAISVIQQVMEDLQDKVPNVKTGVDLKRKAENVTALLHERVKNTSLASVELMDVIARVFPSTL
jgi:hypothetical protein